MSLAIDSAKALWPEKVNRIEELEHLLRELEKYRDAAHIAHQLKREMAWAIVGEREAYCSKLEAEKDSAVLKIDEMMICIKALEEKLSDVSNRRIHHTDLQSKSKELETTTKNDIREKETKYRKVKNEMLLLEDETNEINKEITDARAKLSKYESRCESSTARSDDGFKDYDDNCSLELDSLRGRLLENKSSQDKIRSKMEETCNNIALLKARQKDMSKSLNLCESQRMRIEGAKSDRLRRFGEKMPEIVSAISESRDLLHRLPLGPIGVYLSISAGFDMWSSAFEAILGKDLDNFLVCDHHDRAILQSIIQRKFPGFQVPGIIVIDYEKGIQHDMHETKINVKGLHPKGISALECLEISNTVVMKALVINNNIERVMFLNDRDAAIEIMGNSARPSHIDVIYTVSHQIRAGQKSVSCFPLYQNSSGFSITNDASLVVYWSTFANFRKINADIERIKSQASDVGRQLAQLELEYSSLSREVANLNDTETGLLIKIKSLELKQQQISEVKREPRDQDSNVYSDEVSRYKEKIDRLVEQFKSIAQSRASLEDALLSIQNGLDQSKGFLQGIVSKAQDSEKMLASCLIEKKEVEGGLLTFRTSLEREEENLSNLKEQCVCKRIEVDAMRQEAARLGEEVFTNRSPNTIDQELTLVTASLNEAKKKHVDPIKLKADLKDYYESYEKSKQEVATGEILLEDMQRSLEKRQKLMDEFRLQISRNSHIEFIVLLSARGYSGSLNYDHISKELHLNILTGGAKHSQDRSRDIKQLSGGEKSFGTACLLLSLWDSVGAPIRCLDEFDVFMDAVNRRIVLDLLLDHAKTSNFQFILITPIPLNDFLSEHPEIHVVRMKDPEKSQK